MTASDVPLEAIDVPTAEGGERRQSALAAGLRSLSRRGESLTQPRAMLVVGGILMPVGVALVLGGWFGAAHTTRLFEEVPYLISGGLLGLAVVVLGCAFYFGYWQTRIVDQQRSMVDALERIEVRLAGRGALGDTAGLGASVDASVALVVTRGGSLYHRADCPVVDGRPARELTPVTLPTSLAPCKLCHPPH